MSIARRGLLLLPLFAAGCGGDAPARNGFAPLTYGYLVPLRLNVAAIEEAAPPPPGPLDDINPVPPAQALVRMAQDRLSAGGSLGRALFTIEDATITRSSGGLDGNLAVRLDVLTSDGTRAGFAEAKVSRRVDGIGSDLRRRPLRHNGADDAGHERRVRVPGPAEPARMAAGRDDRPAARRRRRATAQRADARSLSRLGPSHRRVAVALQYQRPPDLVAGREQPVLDREGRNELMAPHPLRYR